MMGTSLEGHSETVLSVSVTGDITGKIVSGGENGELCLSSLDGSTIHKKKYDGNQDITSIACRQQRPELIYAAMGCEVCAFDVRQLNEPVFSLSVNQEEINQLVLNDKEEFLASCDDSGNIKVINLFEKRVFKTLRKHTNICAGVCFHPKHNWAMFSGGYDSQLIQWDYSKGRSVCVIDMKEIGSQDVDSATYLVNPPFIHTISVSPSGQYLACGTESTKIQMFRTHKRTPEFVASLSGHTKGVSQVHFIDFMDNHLVSGANDGKVCFWDVSVFDSLSAASNGISDHQNGTTTATNLTTSSVDSFATIQHGAKVNWVTSGNKNNQKFVIVADNEQGLVIYPYPQ